MLGRVRLPREQVPQLLQLLLPLCRTSPLEALELCKRLPTDCQPRSIFSRQLSAPALLDVYVPTQPRSTGAPCQILGSAISGGNPSAQLTMSSREIAELTGKRHDHVLVDARRMLDELGLHSPEFSGQYQDSTGRSLPCFNLPKRETLILVSGYSVELRARIIDRWQELEARVPTLNLQDPHTLRALLGQADALLIESQAKRRLADEYDAAQERGEVAVGRPKSLADENSYPQATVADLGLTSKDIHEARLIRDAGAYLAFATSSPISDLTSVICSSTQFRNCTASA